MLKSAPFSILYLVYAHWFILIETKCGARLGEAAGWKYLEHLDAFVVAAGNQEIFTIVGDHEIARMTASDCVVHLLQCSVRENMECGDAIILETM